MNIFWQTSEHWHGPHISRFLTSSCYFLNNSSKIIPPSILSKRYLFFTNPRDQFIFQAQIRIVRKSIAILQQGSNHIFTARKWNLTQGTWQECQDVGYKLHGLLSAFWPKKGAQQKSQILPDNKKTHGSWNLMSWQNMGGRELSNDPKRSHILLKPFFKALLMDPNKFP